VDVVELLDQRVDARLIVPSAGTIQFDRAIFGVGCPSNAHVRPRAPSSARPNGETMQALPGQSLKGVANAKENCEKVQAAAEEMVGADTDAVFESACRFIVMKSLPGWMEEICTKHLQGSSTCFPSRIRRVRNAHASVWKKAQASLDDRDQTSDQKIDA
jgi:hypothetical protein